MSGVYVVYEYVYSKATRQSINL